MFNKITKQIKVSDYQLLNTQSKFGIDIDGEFKGIHYSFASSPDFAAVLALIPERYQKDFCLSMMVINHPIPPHTDSGIKTVVNLYLETGNCITQFYDVATDKPDLIQIDNQTDGYIFNDWDLHLTGFFVALPGEAWVLDVTRPHSVEPRGEMTRRVAVTLATQDHDYNDVILMLKETGSL